MMRRWNVRMQLQLCIQIAFINTLTIQAILQCPIGFGSTEMQSISDDRINDDFCDCPTNGADEPSTNACAGIDYWPGRNAAATDDQTAPSLLYTCPQQPHLSISVSKLYDGICDCCDGADEYPNVCVDNCAELLAAERERKQQAKETFDQGYKKRQAAIAEFESLQQTVQVQVQQKYVALETVGARLEQAKQQVQDWKLEYASARLAHVESISMKLATAPEDSSSHDALGLLEALTDDELFDVIIHACQSAGEMEDAEDLQTCGPLRLAGLDAGLKWEPNTYEVNLLRETDDGLKVLGNLFHHYLKQDKKTWGSNSPKKKQHGRRLTRELDDDAYMTDDMYHHEEEDEEEEGEEDDAEEADRLHREMQEKWRGAESEGGFIHRTAPDDENDGGANRDELIGALRETTFSRPRVSFLEQSAEMLDLIEHATKKADEDKKEGDAEGEIGQATDGVVAPALPFEEESVPMVKSKLEQLTKRINRGIDYGVSAKVLLGAFASYNFAESETRRKFLYTLTVGTINHGKLSSVQLWHILRAVVPELNDSNMLDEAETCIAPWTSACPPKVIERTVETRSVRVPSTLILKAAESFCNRQGSVDSSQVCAGKDLISSEMPDGYMDYFVVEPRDDADDLSVALASLSLDLDEKSQTELKSLEDSVNAVEGDKKAIEDSIVELQASIGGDDPSKFGVDGELHSVKDSCFSITTGKYTYELCMFGQAKQKEGSSGGTDLGKWSEATVDAELGQRVWRWERGAKCWNGPQRSAHAYVTCGKDTTIVSADEPETCKYVFQIESFIACDDAFRVQHQL
ncbi:hypothetical protein MPSEU_000303300 [Mayamaea pseudoterrestris]|nr:hypothetical protein MPSEU_000303300 [Mayamaea pseudoterrestris]